MLMPMIPISAPAEASAFAVFARPRWPRLGRRSALFARELLLVLPECLLLLVCIGLIWFSELAPLGRERAEVETSARDATSNLARAFEENTERVVSGIDQILLTARAAYADQKGAFDVAEWAARRVKVDKFAFFLGRVDASGWTRESTLTPPPKPIQIADREHFRAQLDPSRDELFISKPVVGRATGRPALQFTRKLLTPDGRFDGILQVSLDAGELSRFYESLDIGSGFIELVGADGIVRARGPLVLDQLGKPAGDAGLLAAIAASDSGVVERPAGTGESDFISFRKVEGLPLTVLVGFDHADIYAKYRASRRDAVLAGEVMTAAVAAMGLFWIRQRRRSGRDRRALHLTLESIEQGIVMLDAAGRMPVINQRARQLLALPSEIGDRPPRELLQLPPDDLAREPSRPTLGHVRRDDGRIIELQQHRTALDGTVLTYTDVTDRKLYEARIHHLAHHDPLTSLPNRLVLNERLAQKTSIRGGAPERFAVLCLDLDGFKNINDSMGHDMGDALLCAVAGRLRDELRATDLVARTGGDEFIILFDTGSEASAVAGLLAARLIDVLDQPIVLESCHLSVQASIGIAHFPEHGKDARSLLRNADMALYRAKAEGRGLYRTFDTTMDAKYQERRQIEQDLRTALDTEQIELYMQPQFDSEMLRVSGFEALVRWRHPVRGLISPGIFIPIAEECGLVSKLGCRVLADACRIAASWDSDCRIAVNVSPLQFLDGTLPAFVAGVLTDTGLPAGRLEIEVTEGVLIGDDSVTLESLRAIKALGVRVALDDFGTGYSSLGYLRRFPFDRIKLDKSFVQAQNCDLGTQAIIDAVLAMTTRLHLDVTAEGVETEDQLNLLRAQGCTELQGFLLGRPMPVAQVQAFLSALKPECTLSPLSSFPGASTNIKLRPTSADVIFANASARETSVYSSTLGLDS